MNEMATVSRIKDNVVILKTTSYKKKFSTA